MKILLLVTALAQAVYSGNVGVQSSNLLAPAGVTYVDGSYHAGLAAGPVAYTSPVASRVFQSPPSVSVSAPAVSVAAPALSVGAPAVSVAAQPVVSPVPYATPAQRYAAIPTVQHVPGVADVPVTRINAQPAVLQKTVDVARPAVQTQRYEVRRPAIQKQFYDIEERVVVRPAGSAVVELDEPLSKTQKGPSVIRPTGEAVAVSSSSSVTVPAAAGIAAVAPAPAPAPAPAELPSVEINLARSSAPAPASVSFQSSELARGSIVASAPAPAPSVEIRTSFPSSTAAPVASYDFTRTAVAAPASIPSAGFARSAFVAAAPSPSVELRAAPAPSVEFRAAAPAPSVEFSAAAPAPSVEVRASAPAVPSVAFARTAYTASAPAIEVRNTYPVPASASIQSPSFSAPLAPQPIKTVSVSAPIQTATVTGISSISSGVSTGPSHISVSTPAPQFEQFVQSTPAPVSDDTVSIDSADFSLARSSGLARSYQRPQPIVAAAPASVPVQENIFRSELPTTRLVAQQAPAARSNIIVNYPNPVDLIPQSRFRSSAVYSQESQQSEINHQNQQKLLQLLTARGGVTEVGFGRSGSAAFPVEAGQVRARVLSATPAPAYAAPAGERVNTRRVVVSRPIETLQEVEVSQPVTKFERVRVDQPAIVKSASQDIVRVPTSVPVYGKTLAPIADSPVAYSADWQ